MLEEIKRRVIEIGRRAQNEGLCKHMSGNFSMKDEESGRFVITPSGMDRNLIREADMVVMDMGANVVENLSGTRPSSEALMHIRLYEERKDIRAVCHTHSMYATAFAVLKKPIPALVYEMMIMNCKKARIPVAPYGRPGTRALADSVIEACREADTFLLEGHGAVAVDGGDIETAYLKASYIEEFAKLYHLTLAIGGGAEPPAFPEEELRKWAYPSEIILPKEKGGNMQ